jgi:hypothetical protein
MSLTRRIEALERRNTAACPMISGAEVSGIKSQLRRKLGLPAETGDARPLSRKAVDRDRGSALQKLRVFLETHSA